MQENNLGKYLVENIHNQWVLVQTKVTQKKSGYNFGLKNKTPAAYCSKK